MKHLNMLLALVTGVVLMGCSGSTGMLDDSRSVSTTYTIAGSVFDDEGGVVTGQMGCWDITDGMSNIPDYTFTISNTGGFVFSNLPAGRDYYVWVWITPQLYEGWVTDRQPLFLDLSRDERIHFVGILPD